MKKTFSIYCLLVFISTNLFSIGLIQTISLEDRVTKSSHLVEGAIVKKYSFWNENKSAIYTANLLEVYKVFKGNITSDTIRIITPGGQVGYDMEEVKPSLELAIGNNGLFLLNNSVNFSNSYIPYASLQGFIRYVRSDNIAYDYSQTFYGIETDLYSAIQSITNNKITIIKKKKYTTTKTLAVHTITNLSPLTISAGTKDTLTITGTDFGTSYTTAADDGIWFINGDNPATIISDTSQIISWTDTEIKTTVPDNAANGTVQVKLTGATVTSVQNLNISFAITNLSNGLRGTLVKLDANNGYIFTYNTDFNATAGVTAAFERALNTWQCNQNINFEVAPGTTAIKIKDANDGINAVYWDNATSGELPVGVLGRAQSSYTSCDGINWIVKNLDIVFDDESTWNFATAAPAGGENDFESVALHELGHTIQLGHVNDPGVPMHFSITTGTTTRNLDATAIAGSNNVLSFSSAFPGESGCGFSFPAGGMDNYSGVLCPSVPVANNFTLSLLQDGSDTAKVSLNSSDGNGDTLTTTIKTSPTKGSTIISGKEIIYTPNAGFFGLDTIVYKVCDPGGLCDSANIFITVNAISAGSFLVFNTAGTLITEPFTTFSGKGFSPTGMNGKINSANWSVIGLQEGNVNFGDSITTSDFALDTTSGGETRGGIYAFLDATNPMLGVQSTGNDFTPGEFIVRVQNNTGKIIDTMSVSFDLKALNNGGRSSSITTAYSKDNITFTTLANLTDTSATTAGAGNWGTANKTAKIGGLAMANASFFYLKWTFQDVAGTGSRDELGIDNIMLKPDTVLDCPTVILINPDTISCTNTTVSVDGSGSPIGPSLSYLWTTPNGNITANGGTTTATVDRAGTYILTITNTASTCAKSDTLTVIADTIKPTATITGADTVSCNTANNTLDASTSVGANTYAWTTSNGTISSATNGTTATADSAGIYQVLVTATNGCKDSTTATIISNFTLPVNSITTPDSITCSVTSVGVSAKSSTNADTYQWTALAGGNITSASNIDSITVNAIGQYKLETANITSGCLDVDTVTVVADNSAPTASIANADTIKCTVPTIVIDASASTDLSATITYAWSTTDGTIVGATNDTTIVASAAGTYKLTITNTVSGCIDTTSVTVIADNTAPIASISNSDSLTCTNVTLSLDGSSSSNYTSLVWSTSDGTIVGITTDSTATISAAGTYQLKAINSGSGCSDSTTVTISQNTTLPTVAIATADTIKCTAPTVVLNGTASSQGTSYSYLWTGGTVASGSTTDSATTSTAGNYQLKVMNTVTGCSDSSSVTVVADNSAPTASIANADTIKCTVPTIVIDASASTDLSATITYAWSTTDGTIVGATNDTTIVASAAGTYKLTITNTVSGCIDTTSVTVIADNTAPIASISNSDSLTCTNVTLSLDGSSSSNYTSLEWSTSDGTIVGSTTDSTATISAAGTYQLKAINSGSGCSDSTTVTISQNVTLPTVVIAATDTIKCTAPTVVLNGTSSSQGANYSYLWTGGTVASGSTTDSATTSTAGNYQLKVTNTVTGCTDSASVTVNADNSAPTASLLTPDTIKCTVPTIVIDASASTDPSATITYAWSTTDGTIVGATNDTTIVASAAGTYKLTITNTVSGCFDTAFVTVIADNTAPIASISNSDSLTCNNVTLSLDGSASTNYTSLVWSTSDGTIVGSTTDSTATISAAGTYQLKAINSGSGCSDSTTVTISQNVTLPTVVIAATDTIKCTAPTVVLNGTSSSQGASYSYLWTGGTVASGSTTDSATTTTAGTYQLKVTNTITGCADSSSVTVVADNSAPSASIANTDTIKCTAPTVIIDGSASTDPSATITYAWTTTVGTIVGATNDTTIVASAAGTYKLTITNTVSGCFDTASVIVIADNTAPIASISNSDSLTCNNLTLSIDGSASTNYTSLVWSTSDGTIVGSTTDSTATIGAAGTYQLKAINLGSGCSDSTTVTISQNTTLPTVAIAAADTIKCTAPTVVLNGTGSSQGANFGYLWTGGTVASGSTTDSATASAAGNYQLKVTDNTNGCYDTASVNVVVETNTPSVSIITPDTITCNNSIVTLKTTSTNVDSYNWSTTGGNITSVANLDSIVVDKAGAYTVDVVNTTSNCSSSVSVTVIENKVTPVITVVLPDTLSCLNKSVLLDASSTPNGDTYLWTGGVIVSGANTSSARVNTVGLYQLKVTNLSSNCSDSTTVNVIDNPNVKPAASFTEVATSLSVSFTDASTGNGISSIDWDFGDGNTSTQPNPTNVYAVGGTYTVQLIVSDSCGADTTTKSITVSTCANTFATINTSICNGAIYTFPDGNSITPVADMLGVLDTILNNAGCDSIITTNLTVKAMATSNQSVSNCITATINGKVYTSSQTIKDTLSASASNGCDSIIITNLTINQPSSSSQNITACNNATINGNIYTSTQVVTDVMLNLAGCDSTIVTNLTITQPDTINQNISACGIASINGKFYTTSQIVTDVLKNVGGCDSTVITNLTITNVSSSNQNITACGSATINGQVYTSSQVVTDILKNAEGCDSTVTTTLTITNPTSSNTDITACESAVINGKTYTSSQVITDILQGASASGCDSTVVTNLTINNKPVASFTTFINDLEVSATNTSTNSTSQTWTSGDGNNSTAFSPTHIYNVAGTYTVTLTAINGCGSVTATEQVTVEFNNPPTAQNATANTEQNKSVVINLTSKVSDIDNDQLTITTTNPTNGTVFVNGKIVTYTPQAGFVGADSLTYFVCDNRNKCDTAQINISVLGPCFVGDIFGTVKADTTTVSSGTVELYSSGGQKEETATLVNGTYKFTNVLIGGYRLFATGTLNGTKLIPEYYKDAKTWVTATVIDVVCRSQVEANFNMQQEVVLAGNSSVGGTIANGSLPTEGVNVSIALATSPNLTLATTKTDINGNFVFNNLPSNTNFVVTADGVGSTAGTQTVSTNSSSQVVDFCENAGSIGDCNGVGFEDLDKAISSLKVYPIPFENNLTVQFTLNEEADVKVVLTNKLGRILLGLNPVSYTAGEHQINLNNLNVSSGVYFLQLEVNNTTKVYKVVKLD